MKRLLFLGAGGALLFTMGGVGPAQADNGPHVTNRATAANATPTTVGADGCAACHRVHTAKSADGFLLKTTDQKTLCYSCHGTGATGAGTDVQNGVGYEVAGNPLLRTATIAGALRGGGFEKALIDTAGLKVAYEVNTTNHPGEITPINTATVIGILSANVDRAAGTTTSSHSIDGSSQTIWGNGAISAGTSPVVGKTGVTLECGSCHDPHGNKNYRILRPVPNDAATTAVDYKAGPPEVKAVLAVVVPPVAIPDQPTKVYTTLNYYQTEAPGVPKVSGKDGTTVIASPDGFIGNISDWCLTCHTRYEGKGRSTNTGDAVYTYRHTTNKIDRNGTRNCITCHVAHGSNAKMTGASAKVEMPNGSTATAGASDSRLLRVNGRGVCLMCHNQ